MASASPASVRYAPVDFAEVGRWEDDDHLAALRAFRRSCGRRSCGQLGGAEGARSPSPMADTEAALLRAACAAAMEVRATRAAAKAFFEAFFEPYRLVHDGPQGLLTGYYEPLLPGSRTPTRQFHVPIYRRPADLENVVAESQRGARADALTHVRRIAGGTEPYATRAEIEAGALAGRGLELVWLADPVDAFFLHVQGSGLIELAGGDRVRITYDGKNGYPYTSIGRTLIEAGDMTAEEMSLESLGRWLRQDGERGRRAMWRNESFVFFRELAGEEANSAMGALDIPLTPGRSLAVDTAHHALGTPIWVMARELKHARPGPAGAAGFDRLMIAQDVGSAIRGPERGDIYFGSGARAGRLAGVTRHPGEFVVLRPRPGPRTSGARGVQRQAGQ